MKRITVLPTHLRGEGIVGEWEGMGAGEGEDKVGGQGTEGFQEDWKLWVMEGKEEEQGEEKMKDFDTNKIKLNDC